ncbi:hypothetical protein ACNO8X_04030 [Mycobacterium sp. PDNC021]
MSRAPLAGSGRAAGLSARFVDDCGVPPAVCCALIDVAGCDRGMAPGAIR